MSVGLPEWFSQARARVRGFNPESSFIQQRRGWMRHMTVRGKLILMMVVSTASLVLLAILFFSAIDEVKVSGPIYKAIAREMDLRSDILPPPEFIVETHLTVLQIQKALQSDPAGLDALVKNLAGLRHDYEDRQAYWDASLPNGTPLEAQIRDGILSQANKPASQYFQIVAVQLLPALKNRDSKAVASIIDAQLVPLYVEHKAAIERLADLTQKSQDLREQQAKHTIYSRILLLMIVIMMSLLGTLAVGFYASNSITGPLKSAVKALEGVATRDLTPRLDVRNGDEVGAMSKAFNVAMQAIRNGFSEADDIAGVVSRVSNKLETAARKLSDGTQAQAAALQETSGSLEELNATVTQNATSAKEASDLSKSSASAAVEGTTVMEAAIQAMADISAASIQIGNITSSIDEIAFHTHILAVNAAIEAARAGEQGRGFAVVAAEVRTLAQRSASSAREIKQLIQDTVSKVEHGSAQVTRSGETLHQIAASAKQVADVVSSISHACSEQALAINNVSTAVSGVDGVTQSNAAQSEELFVTAKHLLSTSAALQKMVGSFNIGEKQATGYESAKSGKVRAHARSIHPQPVPEKEELALC